MIVGQRIALQHFRTVGQWIVACDISGVYPGITRPCSSVQSSPDLLLRRCHMLQRLARLSMLWLRPLLMQLHVKSSGARACVPGVSLTFGDSVVDRKLITIILLDHSLQHCGSRCCSHARPACSPGLMVAISRGKPFVSAGKSTYPL